MTQYTDIYKRIWGNVDIDNIVVVSGDNDSLSIEIEGGDTEILTITDKTYKLSRSSRKSEIIDELNAELALNGKLRCYLGSVRGDTKYECIVFQSTDETNITSVTGTFADSFFI